MNRLTLDYLSRASQVGIARIRATADHYLIYIEMFEFADRLDHVGHVRAGSQRHDLSGAATDGDVIVLVDDGDNPPPFNAVTVTRSLPDVDGVNVPFTLSHRDVEGATWNGRDFVVTTSMNRDASGDFNRVTRFKLDREAPALVEEESVNLKPALLAALKNRFGAVWYSQWVNETIQTGGLNIEGLAASTISSLFCSPLVSSSSS